MKMLHRMLVDQSPVGEPERRGDERSEAPRSGGSSAGEREVAPVPPDPEVPARHVRRRFTTAYKLEILRKVDACTRPGELGALLRREGLYSSHLVTWRRQREQGLAPKKRGRKPTSGDPRLKKLAREKAALDTANRRHHGRAARVHAQRTNVLAAAYAAHPERFVNGQPTPADLPQAVWINPPEKKTAAQDAPGTTSRTSVDLQDPLLSCSGEHSAATTIDLGATLITSPLVSQCH